MSFEHSHVVRAAFPNLVCSTLRIGGLTSDVDASPFSRLHIDRARDRLSRQSEGDWPEIQAWRRAFSAMGLKPTQYRCAAEALLRRLRKDGELPSLHPLIDICNAISVAFAIPIAVFDTDRIEGGLMVKPAQGDERYHAFSGAMETPEPGEIIFADGEGRAHSRRWTNRQSAASAVGPVTSNALIVAEALHTDADADMIALKAAVQEAVSTLWPTVHWADRGAA
ncbi:hypothetical protein ASG43_04330 [Aureimonas sp. Leaf454]|nr:hypothetical protein ASG43_04330 [Aureimonas sp. Leaf454]